MRIVVDTLPDTKLIIVGEKMDGYAILVKTAKELGITNVIMFKGFVSFEEPLERNLEGVMDVMRKIELFCLSAS